MIIDENFYNSYHFQLLLNIFQGYSTNHQKSIMILASITLKLMSLMICFLWSTSLMICSTISYNSILALQPRRIFACLKRYHMNRYNMKKPLCSTHRLSSNDQSTIIINKYDLKDYFIIFLASEKVKVLILIFRYKLYLQFLRRYRLHKLFD